ncbi:MAG: glycerol kinase [Deltaproteobacteria bacterium]|nr:glycerol kinase [Deltaproteobacteria bacterium]MBW2413507.1 glycerol kinase [Deltaproteobacteria bacterium]
MSGALVLALDLGTTSVRALLVDRDGEIRSIASRALSATFPEPGWIEQDPTELWERSVDVLREALASGRAAAGDVAGIGVVTQRATCLAWDAATLQPLASAIGWQDQRSSARVAELRALGIPINTMASATKFEWWMQHDDAIAKAAAAGTLRLGTPDTWLTSRLTGGAAHVTDPGNASCTALFDPQTLEIAPALCAVFGVPFDSLPTVEATSGVVGEMDPTLLGSPIPVAARAGDQQAAAFAQGVFSPGDAKLTLGTSAMLDVHSGDGPAEFGPGAYPLALWKLSDGSRAFCLEGTVITAGSCVEWLVDLGVAPDAASVDALANGVESSQGVIFVPALQGLGTPLLDDRARGLVLGLTRGSGRAELARATLEGIAQRCTDVIEALGASGPAPLAIDGGLGQSRLLVQSLADFSGRELRRASEVETTALGAAFLAGLAVGVWPSPEACREVIAPPTVFEPRLSASERESARDRWADALRRAAGDP